MHTRERNSSTVNLTQNVKTAQWRSRTTGTYYFLVEISSQGFYDNPCQTVKTRRTKGKEDKIIDHAAKTALRAMQSSFSRTQKHAKT